MAKLKKAVFKLDPGLLRRVDALLKTPEARANSLCRSDIYRFAVAEYLAAREKLPAPEAPKPLEAAPKAKTTVTHAPKPYAPGPGAKAAE